MLSEDWVEVLVDFRFDAANRSDKDCLVNIIEKQVSLMKSTLINIADIQEYWPMVLQPYR